MGGCNAPSASPWVVAGLGIAAVITAIPSLAASAHILLNQRGSTSTLAWFAAAWMFPVVGPGLWFGLGADPHVPTAPGLKFWHDRYAVRRPESEIPDEIPPELASPEFAHLAPMLRFSRTLTRTPLFGGNEIRPLYNGEQGFPEMVQAIEDEPAGGFVSIGMFIFENNRWGVKFAEALKRAMERGVTVEVIVDKWGNVITVPGGVAMLKKYGIPVRKYNPPAGLRNAIPWNVVYHKKFMTTSRVSFLGSMNIGDSYTVTDPTVKNPHQDLTYAIRGPVVSDVASVHAEDWAFLNGTPIASRETDGTRRGGSFARVIRSSPDADFENFKKVLIGALRHARHNVRIVTAYFAPDQDLIDAMRMAALSGVKVELMLSEDAHIPFIDWGSRAIFDDLINDGVRIIYQPPPFNHSKYVTVDGIYNLFGSCNLGPRYLTGNAEVNLEVYDRAMAAEFERHFDGVKSRSRLVTMDEVRGWPLFQKLRNGFFRLFSWLY